MKKFCKFLIILFVVYFIACVSVKKWLESELESSLKQGNINLGWMLYLGDRVYFRSLHAQTGKEFKESFRVEVKSLWINFSWLDLFDKKIRIEKASLSHGSFSVEEPDAYEETVFRKKEGSGSAFAFEVEEIQVENFEFYYLHTKKNNQTAKLHLTKINATAERLDQKKDLLIYQMKTEGLLEDQGKFTVTSLAHPSSPNHKDHVQIKIDQFQLKKMNTFLSEEERIQLDGFVDSFKVDFEYDSKNLAGKIEINYKDAEIEFMPSETRSAFESWFLENLSKATTYQNSDRAVLVHHFSSVRKESSIFLYMLRPLLEGLQNVLSRKEIQFKPVDADQ